MRELEWDEIKTWGKQYEELSRSTDVNKMDQIAKLAEKIEKDLEVIAITAIEDRLQDEAPETIESLKRAGISFWMLTGDKTGTAKNIGYSCKLLTARQKVYEVLETGKEHEIWKKMREDNKNIEILEKITGKLNEEKRKMRREIQQSNAIVVNGAAIEAGISDEL